MTPPYPLTGAERRIVPSPETRVTVTRPLRIARPPALTLVPLRRRSVFTGVSQVADSDIVTSCLRVTPGSAYISWHWRPFTQSCRAKHDASAHVAPIRQQSLVGLGARGNDPRGYSTSMRQRSGCRRLASGRSRKMCIRPRLPRDPVVIEVVEAAERSRQ
jgi:hypothetical protein